jgi:hypothetical protein
MTGAERRERLLTAVESGGFRALHGAVKQLLDGGEHPQAVLNDLYDIRALAPDEDEVLDTMDLLCGWCHSDNRLVDPPLKGEYLPFFDSDGQATEQLS